jgi:peptidyl-prolyl cis-trans isomerase SurA
MNRIAKPKGVNAKVQIRKKTYFPVLVLSLFALFLAACENGAGPGSVNPNETVATVNGKAIKMEEVERAIKQQAQGQEGQLSQLELTAARLQVLQGLIEQEVMFQKAESEGTLPTDEEVNAEFNKRKVETRLSQEEFGERLKEAGETEATARDAIRRGLAIQKLTEKVSGKVEAPSASEIEQFYTNNPEAFKNRRGAQLAAIVVDPRNPGDGSQARTQVEVQSKVEEIGKRLQGGGDFATIAREYSEDPNTALRGGDWRYFSEDEMKQAFGDEFAEFVMTKLEVGQLIPQIIPFEGRILFVKLQRKLEKDEDRAFESPGVKEEIADFLTNSRKQLLAASYQALAMSEARIENYLAKRVVENPNDLSGVRPVPPANANVANANTESPDVNANSAPANSEANAANTQPANNGN